MKNRKFLVVTAAGMLSVMLLACSPVENESASPVPGVSESAKKKFDELEKTSVPSASPTVEPTEPVEEPVEVSPEPSVEPTDAEPSAPTQKPVVVVEQPKAPTTPQTPAKPAPAKPAPAPEPPKPAPVDPPKPAPTPEAPKPAPTPTPAPKPVDPPRQDAFNQAESTALCNLLAQHRPARTGVVPTCSYDKDRWLTRKGHTVTGTMSGGGQSAYNNFKNSPAHWSILTSAYITGYSVSCGTYAENPVGSVNCSVNVANDQALYEDDVVNDRYPEYW